MRTDSAIRVHVLMLLYCVMLSGSLFPAAVHAATAMPTSAQTAELVVANRTVMVFRAPLAGYTAQERADAAERRLEKALAKPGEQRAATRPIAEGTQVLLAGQALFLVTPGDVNALAGDTTDEVASESARRLAQALQDRRDRSSVRHLAIAGAFCLLATAVYGGLLHMVSLAQRSMRERCALLLGVRMKRVRSRYARLLDAEQYVPFALLITVMVAWALRLLFTFVWGAFVLAQVPYTRGWGERLGTHLLGTAAEAAHAAANALPGLLLVALITVVARLAMATATSIFRRVESGEVQGGWLDQETAPPTRRIVNIMIGLFALAMAYPYLPGSHTAAFQGVSVLAGLMVSIGASSVVAQAASGLILIYTRSLRKGEYVRIGAAEGTVSEVGMFATRLRTGFGEEIALPNAFILGNTVCNFSRARPGTGYMLDTSVTIGYDTPWRQVHALLKGAAAATPGIAADPAPIVALTALTDFYIEYKLIAYAACASPRDRAHVLTHLHQNIVDGFNLHGVQIMSPHFTEQPATPHVVAPANWHRSPADAPAVGAAQCDEPELRDKPI
ncbi:mechanosensitive ion channel-like protein [Pseudoduganella flava]|uniref:Small-conductance mechanosensitive channel n=1 Tax=Pseudoduganella flava TaxID=871742 RepID=A0A562PHB9_9BURK|nr:mechanosensitive ion channel domain-containing protein [Pseudoduganella flava]QGZ42621.1 mechanosensitive ion channel [Pseudoduganella flava]TWI43778.1 mechanosensitive ion channel-like protein [Pseudoduganella flava]